MVEGAGRTGTLAVDDLVGNYVAGTGEVLVIGREPAYLLFVITHGARTSEFVTTDRFDLASRVSDAATIDAASPGSIAFFGLDGPRRMHVRWSYTTAPWTVRWNGEATFVKRRA